jgi:hypothetical protein
MFPLNRDKVFSNQVSVVETSGQGHLRFKRAVKTRGRKPKKRGGHGSAVVGHRLFIGAGYSLGTYIMDLWTLDLLKQE